MKKVLFSLVILFLFVVSFSQVSLVDDLGRLVTFNDVPTRIISAAPAVSDYLTFLNLQDSVVGVTDWDSHIEAERIGNLIPLNIEKIISLNPDVVFLTGGFQEPEVERLERHGIKAFVINPLTFNEIYRSVTNIGVIMGKQEEAQKLSRQLREKVVNIAIQSTQWTNKPTIFFAQIDATNLNDIWTAGTGSFINELISIAGGRNIAASYTGNNGWLSVGKEFLIINNPEIIVIPAYFGDISAKEALQNTPQLRNVSAIKNRKIILIDGNEASQASPSLINVLEQLFKEFGELK